MDVVGQLLIHQLLLHNVIPQAAGPRAAGVVLGNVVQPIQLATTGEGLVPAGKGCSQPPTLPAAFVHPLAAAAEAWPPFTLMLPLAVLME